MLPFTFQINRWKTMGRKKLTYGYAPNTPILCSICGDKARGNNFSVLSCVSCKSFFRRHGLIDSVCSSRKQLFKHVFLSL